MKKNIHVLSALLVIISNPLPAMNNRVKRKHNELNNPSLHAKRRKLTRTVHPFINSKQIVATLTAAKKDIITFQKYLSENPNFIYAHDSKQDTPLHLAAYLGYEDVVQTLINTNAKIDASNKNGFTPLFYAIKKNHASVIQQLLQCSANPNHQDVEQNTPIHFAAQYSTANVIDMLFQAGAHIDVINKLGHTPLMINCITGNRNNKFPLIKLLEQNPSLDLQDSKGYTALHCAIMNKAEKKARYLLAHGANPFPKVNYNGKNVTALELARIKKNNNLAYLIQVYADIQTNNVSSFLTACANMKNSKQLETFKVFNFSFYLHKAVLSGNQTIARRLLSNFNANPNLSNALKQTPLHRAAIQNNAPMVALLLQHKANANRLDIFQNSPLFYALQHKNKNIIQMLLDNTNLFADQECGVKIYDQLFMPYASLFDDTSKTITADRALAAFAEKQKYDTHNTLENKISPDSTNIFDDTLNTLFGSEKEKTKTKNIIDQEKQNKDVIQIIQKHLDILNQDKDIKTSNHRFDPRKNKPLTGAEIKDSDALLTESEFERAIKEGNYNVVRYYLISDPEKWANYTFDEKGHTPLTEACRYGHINIVNLLLSDNIFSFNSTKKPCADPNKATKSGWTPLMYCTRDNQNKASQLKIAQSLILKGANINAQNQIKSTALMIACNDANATLIKLFIQHNAQLNIQDWVGKTALHHCKNYNTVKYLVKNGANPYIPSIHNKTVLQRLNASQQKEITQLFEPRLKKLKHALMYQYNQTVRALLTQDSTLVYCPLNRHNHTILMRAINQKNMNLFNFILRLKPGQVNMLGKHGESALIIALKTGQYKLAEYLIKHGANPYIISLSDKKNALDFIPNEKQRKVFALYFNRKQKLFLQAIKQNNKLDITKMLFEDPYLAEHAVYLNNYKTYPLIESVKSGNLKVAQVLLQKNADINAQDSDGFTPLMWAIQNKHSAVAKELLTKGANTMHGILDNQELITPINLAKKQQLHELAILLEEKEKKEMDNIDLLDLLPDEDPAPIINNNDISDFNSSEPLSFEYTKLNK